VKIALCQINPTVGAFEYNRDKISTFYQKALSNGADLVVCPELSISGYPPTDLLFSEGFVENNLIALEEVCKGVTKPLIAGFIRQINGSLYNSAAICSNGQVIKTYDKILLPSFDVFDEDRYFTPGTDICIWELNINNEKYPIGIQICEDLWDDDYDRKVSQELKNFGAEIIINLSASPYHRHRLEERLEVIEKQVESTKCTFLYLNMVGAQDELIFDGQSVVLNNNGKLLAQGKAFQEDLIFCELNSKQSPITLRKVPVEEELYQALVLGVQDYFRKTGHIDAVIGLSGGIDSSLVACIAVDALGSGHVHGVSMPSRFSSEHSKNDAKKLAENLGIDFRSIEIEDIVSEYEETLATHFEGEERNVAEENIQARTRGNLLMALSNKFNWLVLSTGNKTELALGYCTLYGDMSGGLAVISDLSKLDVYALSKWVNNVASEETIPVSCIEKPPSAELAPHQVDPFNYNVVSSLVDRIVENNESPASLINDGADPKLVKDLFYKIRVNEYKRRQASPGLRLSPKAFGMGRRFPIVNHFF